MGTKLLPSGFYMWVVADEAGLIVGASLNEGDAEDVNFLMPLAKGSKLFRVKGSVTIGAHIDAPTVFPPASPVAFVADLPLFRAASGAPEDGQS